jgi:hypothetical protein
MSFLSTKRPACQPSDTEKAADLNRFIIGEDLTTPACRKLRSCWRMNVWRRPGQWRATSGSSSRRATNLFKK